MLRSAQKGRSPRRERLSLIHSEQLRQEQGGAQAENSSINARGGQRRDGVLSFGSRGGDEAFGEGEVDVFLALGVAGSDFDETIANPAYVIGRGALGCE